MLLNIESPLTFNIPKIEVLFDSAVNPETFKAENNVALSYRIEIPETCKVFVFKDEY